MRRSLFLLAALFSAAFVLAPSAWAQENATITGTVVGSHRSGGSECRNHSHQRRDRPGQTGRVEQLGDLYCSLTWASATSIWKPPRRDFEKFSRTDIVVNTDQTLKEDVNLTVGNAAQTVTVEANALQVQSETSELSTLITGQQVTQLATNGRNVTALAALGMGVSTNLPAFSGVNALTSRQRHQLQWSPHYPQHLPVGWRRTERSRLRRLLQLPALDRCALPNSRLSTATTHPITASAQAEPSSW